MNHKKQYHILNGDALLEQWPSGIKGDTLVFRECLISGPVQAKNQEVFFERRAQFLAEEFGAGNVEEYHEKTVPEIREIQELAPSTPIYLWFEEDLFCQANFWFLLHLLIQPGIQRPLYFVKPLSHSPYSFGWLSSEELINCFQQAQLLAPQETLSLLWPAYQGNNTSQLIALASDLEKDYPFILAAVQAHLDRLPDANGMGRPQRSLLAISERLQTKAFGPIFQAFCKEESIYGFGDLQVKRMWETLGLNN